MLLEEQLLSTAQSIRSTSDQARRQAVSICRSIRRIAVSNSVMCLTSVCGIREQGRSDWSAVAERL